MIAEKANYSDIGIRSNGKRFSGHLSFYRRHNEALIDRIKDSLNGPWRPMNLQSFNIKGFETNVQYQCLLKKFLKSQGGLKIAISTGLSQLVSGQIDTQRISQFTLNYLPLQWISQLKLQTSSLRISFNFRYLERYGLLSNQTSHYTLLDTRIDYMPKFKSKRALKFFITIQNIGNTVYKDFAYVPLMGRWFSAGLSY